MFPGVLFSQFTLDTIPVLTSYLFLFFFTCIFFFLRGRMILTKDKYKNSINNYKCQLFYLHAMEGTFWLANY